MFLNFDSINLMRSLYGNTGARNSVNDRIPALESAAVPGNPEKPSNGSQPDDQKLASEELRAGLVTLETPGLGIGWQDSFIVHRFCAYEAKCGDHVPPISRGRLLLDVSLWITGLLTSCLFLSLGAPFWYGMLQKVVNFKTELEKTKSPSPSK